ncbi:MAG: copper homeostasis protein CutC [Chitinophagaceae bacterium]|nr:copper homeostasis protein CutC [Chitinophagaceae bacterium]
MKGLLEVAVFTMAGALEAIKAGAHRLEMCENAHDGGTTPSKACLDRILNLSPIPVFPIIRPRGGDFVYNEEEKQIILNDIAYCRALGFPGVVSGALLRNGQIDTEFLHRCMEAAGSMEFTFHRAFDRCAHPLNALEELITAGAARILTSGQYPVLPQGIPLIKQLVETAQNRIIILPGSGLTQNTVEQVVRETGVREVHTSARKTIVHSDTYQPSTFPETMSYTGVDANEIQSILRILDAIHA